MILNAEEKQMLYIYYSGTAAETAEVLRETMGDIIEPDIRAAAASLLRKLERMGDAGIDLAEMEDVYG